MGFCLFTITSDRLWGPNSLVSNGYWGLLKQPEREANHSHLSIAAVSNAWSYY